MTRDEAVTKIWCPQPPQEWAMGKTNAEHFIDQLVALGMLQLTEAMSPHAQLIGRLRAYQFTDHQINLIELAIDAANVEIVKPK